MNQNQPDEQIFFNDPALDRAFGVVMALATEVYVLKDRQTALERILSRNGLLDLELLDAEPSEEERLNSKSDREQFVYHLMQSLTGKQVSKG
ncbi:MAG: hypothetical protein CMM67_02145 [Rhodospirillaceae bacterium]|nr:hypothetical protein [Rhodospirillaceae bacterium]OUT80315.1 MAG: hypothetical protein CBB83_01950 [Rhodospirillaceae bacterium TMED23]|tara:strand:- start:900 stop:1175 length:276 start_codon:yes stop_codon:yes gene_type:complete